jgi:hypothetical protein
MSWHSDKAWSDRYIPTIKGIVGPRLLVESSLDVDQKQATDLIVLRARDMMIAARIRRPGYADTYPNEFTIRSHRDSGAATELEKITDGFGDWMFYGHAADDTSMFLSRWMLIDLQAWRAHLIRNRNRVAPQRKSNGDGTHFVAFDVTRFLGKPPLLVACSHPEQMRPETARMTRAMPDAYPS